MHLQYKFEITCVSIKGKAPERIVSWHGDCRKTFRARFQIVYRAFGEEINEELVMRVR